MELIKIENNTVLLKSEVSSKIAAFEKQIKQIKEQEDLLKQAILEEMENKNILKIETDEIMISYVQPSDRETLDSKALKQDHPDLYDDYIKMTPVKSSIRIKVK